MTTEKDWQVLKGVLHSLNGKSKNLIWQCNTKDNFLGGVPNLEESTLHKYYTKLVFEMLNSAFFKLRDIQVCDGSGDAMVSTASTI